MSIWGFDRGGIFLRYISFGPKNILNIFKYILFLQEIFPALGLNPGLPHCRWILYQLSHQGSPNTSIQFSSAQSLSRVRLFATPRTAARQASLSITNSWSLFKLMSIESVMPSSQLILCRPLLPLPPIPPSIRVFSNESTLRMRCQSTGVSALASFLPKKSQGWYPSEWTSWISLQSKGLSRVFSNTTVQKHQFFRTQLSSQSNSHIHTWPLQKP